MSARCRAAIAAIVVCLAFPGAASAAALEVTGLRLDHRTGELLGVGDPTPVLGWKVAGAGPTAVQTAFQVRVAGSAEALGSGPYLWDSGRVDSREQSAEYAGAALRSRAGVAWQVRAWDASGDASAWSAPARSSSACSPPPTGAGRSGSSSRRRRSTRRSRSSSASRTRATCAWTSPSSAWASTSRCYSAVVKRIQVAEMQILAPDGGATALRARASPRSTSSVPGLGHPADRRRRHHHARLHQPPPVPAGRQPVEVGAGRPRRGPALRPDRALSAQRRAHAGRAGPELPGRLHVRHVVDVVHGGAPSIETVDRPAEPARPRSRNAAADLRARVHRRQAGRQGAPVRRGPRPVRGDAQRRAGHRHVLKPGVTNPSARSSTAPTTSRSRSRSGANTLGVALGNGIANVNPQANAGRRAHRGLHEVQRASGRRRARCRAGRRGRHDDQARQRHRLQRSARRQRRHGVDGGSALEIAHRRTAGGGQHGITLTDRWPARTRAGVRSGSAPARGPRMAVTPRMIARLELTYADGTQDTIVSDLREGARPAARRITDNWYAGVDYDARRGPARGGTSPARTCPRPTRRINGEAAGWSPS